MTEAAWRASVADAALKWVGVKEHPAGTNHGPELKKKGKRGGIDYWCWLANGLRGGYPWCSAFVCGMVRETGWIIPEPRKASVGFLEEWATDHGMIVTRPFRGDLVCYRFDRDDWPDHIGIVDKVISIAGYGTARTIEGNTSAGNDANGGQVQVRYRSLKRCRFIRLNRMKLTPTNV